MSAGSAVRRVAVWASVPLCAAAVVVGSFLVGSVRFVDVLPLVIAVTFAAVGALVLSRHRGHRVGLLLMFFALQFSAGMLISGIGHTDSSAAVWADWAESWMWSAGFVLLVCVLPVIFPDGRLPAGWPRALPWTTLTAWLLFALGNALHPDNQGFAGHPNPAGVPALAAPLDLARGAGALLFAATALAAVVVAVRRYRASRGTTRLQHRWFAISAVTLVACVAAMAVAYERDQEIVALTIFALGSLTVPVAVGVAVLRYRLYDIDRLVSRTVAWAGLSGVLAAAYLGVVLTAQALAPGAGESPLAVAAATLVAAGLFQPARRRIQHAVDRRFYRSRYDAERVLDQFRLRLRDAVALTQLEEQIRDAVIDSMQPATVAVWLREERS